jgi:hypothetical protein
MSAHILPRLTLVGVPLATILIAPGSAEPAVHAVTFAASLITETYWASALFALVLVLAYSSFEEAQDRRRR